MAEFIPLSTPEKNSDASWYTAIGAGLVSGVIKTVEGVVSLGAELIDLGADSNVAADVEKFFDKVNIFEDTADETIGLQEVTISNISDDEGTTMPAPGESKPTLTPYQEKVIEGVEKSQREKEEEKEKQRIKNLQEQPEFPDYETN